MKKQKCSLCGGEMKRNGHTKAGGQRWRCKACNASTTCRYQKNEDVFEAFLSWLFSKETQRDAGHPDRTFRQKIQECWDYWALPPIYEERETVIYVDGLYLTRKVVVLIASNAQGTLGWYLARSENSHAWAALLRRISAPDLVVTDGGTGFEKARKRLWPQTKVQRCLYHVFSQVRRMTLTGLTCRQVRNCMRWQRICCILRVPLKRRYGHSGTWIGAGNGMAFCRKRPTMNMAIGSIRMYTCTEPGVA